MAAPTTSVMTGARVVATGTLIPFPAIADGGPRPLVTVSISGIPSSAAPLAASSVPAAVMLVSQGVDLRLLVSIDSQSLLGRFPVQIFLGGPDGC
jgi:hypothetical protein